MEDYPFSFEKLEVYKLARSLVRWVYRATSNYPKHQRFGLINQIQRAAVSVASNIAEGSGRHHSKDKIHFIHIAYGSLMEVYCQLQISLDLGYVTAEDMDFIKPHIIQMSRMLSGLRKALSAPSAPATRNCNP